ncbi:MAG: cytochrome C oxidase subunit IV family protein [Candidatus Neomarinimicrobiota bacterium]
MSAATPNVESHTRTYLFVFGSLAVLTVITVSLGSLSLPAGLAILVALVIAGVKGSLVAGFFMHLISEQKPIFWLLILTLFLLLALFGLFIAAFYDSGGIAHVA